MKHTFCNSALARYVIVIHHFSVFITQNLFYLTISTYSWKPLTSLFILYIKEKYIFRIFSLDTLVLFHFLPPCEWLAEARYMRYFVKWNKIILCDEICSSTKPTPLCSPSYMPSNEPIPSALHHYYSEPNKLTLTIMALDRQNVILTME